jgi:hypothetical protein
MAQGDHARQFLPAERQNWTGKDRDRSYKWLILQEKNCGMPLAATAVACGCVPLSR